MKCRFGIMDRDGYFLCRLSVGHPGVHEVKPALHGQRWGRAQADKRRDKTPVVTP